MKNLIRAILTVWLSVSTLMSSSAHLSIGGMDTEGSEGTLFIMMDSDEICTYPINIDVLKYHLTLENWDALSFNRHGPAANPADGIDSALG